MASIKQVFGTATAFTKTNANIASSATAGWKSNAIDNSTNLYLDALVQAEFAAVNTPASNKAIYLYAYSLIEGTAYSSTGAAAIDGTEGTVTFPDITANAVNLPLLGVIPYTTQNVAINSPAFPVARCFGGVLPPKWGIAMVNYSGMTLSVTNIYYIEQYNTVAQVGLRSRFTPAFKPTPPFFEVDWSDPVNKSLAVWYPLGSVGGLGAQERDIGPHGMHQTIARASSGTVGLAASSSHGFASAFSGNAYMHASGPDGPFLGGLTISFWVYINSLGGYNEICNKCASNGGTNNPFELLVAQTTGVLTFTRAVAGGFYQFTGPALSINTWYHVVVSTPSADIRATPTFYVNGLATTGTHSAGAGSGNVTGSSSDLWLGQRKDSTTIELAGNLENLRILGRGVSAGEAFRLYADPYAGLIAKGPIRASAVAGGGVTVTVPLATYTLTKEVPAVAAGASAASPLKTYTLSKLTPAVAAGASAAVPVKAFTLSKLTPAVGAGASVATPLKTFTLTPEVPSVSAGQTNVLAPAKSFTLTGQVPAVAAGASAAPSLVSFALALYAPTVTAVANPWTAQTDTTASWGASSDVAGVWTIVTGTNGTWS